MVTREPFRSHGAASLLIKWGVERAKVDNCPAFVFASPLAESLYKRHEFQSIEKKQIDVYGDSFQFVRMVAYPQNADEVEKV